jgi:acyl-CoA synthetase (AMP-forming)/AMP-acid ligase II
MEDFNFRFPLEKCPTVHRLFTTIVEKFSSSIYIQHWKEPNDDHPSSLTYHEVDIITTNLARRLQNEYDLQGQAVAYLADHSIQYGLFLIALVKLECRIMLLSPKNSKAAIVDLMERTDTKFLLHNRRFEKEANAVIDQIDGAASFIAFDVDIEKFKELDNEAQSIPFMDDSSENQTEKIAFIIHSSGTTGFPKPIYLSNRYMVHLLNRYANMFEPVESPKILSLGPLYHIMGVVIFAMGIMGGTYVFPTNVSQNLSISLVMSMILTT